jgi:hypothetical protein
MILELTSFEIDVVNGERYAYLQADVEQPVYTYYSEPLFVPTACEARVLLADDDTNDYSLPEEQMELAEDVTDWQHADPTPYF